MKPLLVLVHGALGSAAELAPLAGLLQEWTTVYPLKLAGHGGDALQPGSFTMARLAEQVQEFATTLGGGPVHAFGYSMGGYVALLAAHAAPQLFASVTTLGTKFDWTPATAEGATRFLDPARMEAKVPAFAELLRQRHAPTAWAEVVTATACLMRGLGEAPDLTPETLAAIRTPVQVLVGEHDDTAGAEASATFAGYLPNATFTVLPNTPHPLERVDFAALAARIRQFVNERVA